MAESAGKSNIGGGENGVSSVLIAEYWEPGLWSGLPLPMPTSQIEDSSDTTGSVLLESILCLSS